MIMILYQKRFHDLWIYGFLKYKDKSRQAHDLHDRWPNQAVGTATETPRETSYKGYWWQDTSVSEGEISGAYRPWK